MLRLLPLSGSKNNPWETLLGMNARNDLIAHENAPQAVRKVNHKYETKRALEAVRVPVPPTLALIRDRLEFSRFSWEALPDAWALKPNCGRGGAGILLAKERDPQGRGWRTGSGRLLTKEEVAEHVHLILEGEFSMPGLEMDAALFEPLIVTGGALAQAVPYGLPDIRVICSHGEPVLAMTRLPTEASEGRANLHQNAVGAAVDLSTGRVTRAYHKGRETERHPDTGYPLLDLTIPHWETILGAARRSYAATGLGFMGVDVVLDRERGPLVIEVNAHPGLEIQNVTGSGLKEAMEAHGGRG